MAQIRDYIRNQSETQTLVSIVPNDGSFGFLQLSESVLKNGFSDLLLYADSGGVTQLVLNTDYELAPADTDWTADEVGFSNKTVYPQFRITNATYQNVAIWATFTNFGVYTSADANFDMVGGSETVTTSATLTVPFGHTRYRFNFDSTSGDIAPTMPNGAFDGQQCILKDTGAANMTRIKGPGFYLGADSGGMYLKSRSILVTWNSDDSVWEMDDAVVAEWVSGNFIIVQKAYGAIEQIYSINVATSSVASGAIFISNTDVISAQTLPVPLATITEQRSFCSPDASFTTFVVNRKKASTTATNIVRVGSSSAFVAIQVDIAVSITGKY